MDLNELLYHHQRALMAVGQAQRDGRTGVNFDLPCYYARRINEYRERRGLTFDVPVVAQWGKRASDQVDARSASFVGDGLGVQRRETPA
ncbi:hypothetical protein CVO77_02610 [Sphingopyxis lindanitolerans]|uniref:Uncharacterized protein n=1 Tax=Sphingopyxis lindanitolerans TaxID=2054227 RepID=A0A2S8B586_9SPHN|nr:hypothetical protein [Sphingopyxis lindanitolerans]PQM27498.1 hypothetical protein CVO77_02610 [Sphingopyxis lindanitolerans]